MTVAHPSARVLRAVSPLVRFQIWHLALLVLFVAIAIVDIQGQCQGNPRLEALASAGFAGYGVLGWLGWHATRRFLGGRLGPLWTLLVFLVAMTALYLLAAVIYIQLESLDFLHWR